MHDMAGSALFPVLLVFLLEGTSLAMPAADEVRRAFLDIRDDTVPHNCEHATEWLLKNREDLKEDLLAELYRTDRQGRDAILHVLFNTGSFQPDERFIRFLLARLPEANTYVRSNMIFEDPARRLPFNGAQWEAWIFIDAHFALFDRYLKEEVPRSKSPFFLWGVAWLAKARQILPEYAPLFTEEVLRRVGENLASDHTEYNASQAVRLFLLLGNQSMATLRELGASKDSQTSSLARATMDALAGKRKGFGYLVSKVDVSQPLLGQRMPEPDWVSSEGEPYFNNDLPYNGR
jgi:hypothetical protein